MNLRLNRPDGVRIGFFVFTCCVVAACSREEAPLADPVTVMPEPATTALVDGARIVNADASSTPAKQAG